MLIWLVVLIVGLVGVLVLFQSGVAGPEGLPALPTAAVVIAVLAIAYLLATRTRGDGEPKLRPFLIGLMIAGLISAAVALISGLLWKSPGPATTERGGDDFALSKDAPRSVRLRKKPSGQFVARAEVNGEPVDVLIDTGASAVILRHADAEKAGIETATLNFATPIATANGPALAAAVHVRKIAIGAIVIDNVEALVAKPGSLNESLLGITFLRRLRSYELSGDFLTLRE